MQVLASIAVQKKLTRRPTAGFSRPTVIVIPASSIQKVANYSYTKWLTVSVQLVTTLNTELATGAGMGQ